jgi:hypothetical protein
MYVTELFWAMNRELSDRLAAQDFVAFATEIGDVINAEDPKWTPGHEWFDTAIAGLAARTGLSEKEVRSFVREEFRFSDAMNYVQVGFPERVILASAPFEKFWPHLVQMQWDDAFANGSPRPDS